MKVTTVRTMPGDEQSLVDSGIPAVFTEAIGAYWIGNARGIVMALTQEQGAQGDWSEWGRQLSEMVVPTGGYVGICLDGQLPLDMPVNLLGGVFDAGGIFQADVRVMARPHPVLPGRLSSNMTWVSFHQVLNRAWIDRLWDTVDRRWLNAGADLLLASYASDVISQIQWDEAVTVDSFGRTLARSSGWAIPLSDAPGFLVGVIGHSPVHTALLSLAAARSSTVHDADGSSGGSELVDGLGEASGETGGAPA